MSYNAQDIIGKTLIAAGPVTIYRAANDSAAPVYTVPVGQSVGVVYSYLLPGSGRASLYWMFNDSNGRPYYTRHAAGVYSLTALKDQGVKTTLEITKDKEAAAAAQAAANMPFTEWLKANIKTVLFIGGAVIILKSVLPELIKRK